MSWPADRKPRYVVGWIDGGAIGYGAEPEHHAVREAYVYDRAHCHRIVRRIRRHPGRLSVDVAQEYAKMLNDVAASKAMLRPRISR